MEQASSDNDIRKYEDAYLNSLSEKEFKGYLIAKSHLGSTFSLGKSIGFTTWLQKNVIRHQSGGV